MMVPSLTKNCSVVRIIQLSIAMQSRKVFTFFVVLVLHVILYRSLLVSLFDLYLWFLHFLNDFDLSVECPSS